MSKDLIGKKVNDLTVMDYLGYAWKSHSPIVKCLCDCGNETEVSVYDWKTGRTRSCGCKNPRRRSRCDHPRSTGYKEISGRYWYAIRIGAEKRGLEFSITIEYAWDLFVKQDRKCAISGIPLVMDLFWKLDWTKSNTASIDRIDSAIGYVPGNIHWTHKHVNRMKQAYDLDYFISMCRTITDNNLKTGEVK
jgi:hypothetical protein